MASGERMKICSLDKDGPPEPGTKCLVINATSEWVTPWKNGLVSKDVNYPVTHYATIERPYPAKQKSNLGKSMLDAKERQKEEALCGIVAQRHRDRR